MGVYIPNMEIPRNCTECLEFKDNCKHYWDYYCTHESRPNDCPLIEIDEKIFNEVIKGYLEGLKAIQNRERRTDESIY